MNTSSLVSFVVTQSVKVSGHGRCQLTDRYLLVSGFHRYKVMKELGLDDATKLDVWCDEVLVTIEFGQIILPPTAEGVST